jgi:hypothetical protein
MGEIKASYGLNNVVPNSQEMSSGMKRLQSQRRRVSKIAFMVCVCSMLSMVATLHTSSKLGQWARTADTHLDCTFADWSTHDYPAYGLLKAEDAKTSDDRVFVCSLEVAVGTYYPCNEDCSWKPLHSFGFLECASDDSPDPDELHPCQCPCETMIEVEKPEAWAMYVAYMSQSLVVTIVGINLGFRWPPSRSMPIDKHLHIFIDANFVLFCKCMHTGPKI